MAKVRVKEGVLEGEKVLNEYGGEFISFKGIPYAAPPVGDLRYRAPQPPKSWEGVREAKEFGPDSLQYDLVTKSVIGSEDSLYLNIYTPNVTPHKTLPVMVWIHGGGFVSGNGRDTLYGPEFLIQHGVIVVTFNYRLEALGFLCLDNVDIPGNAGLKDQVAALRWIKNNIRSFGGDPGNITIFGESAGAVSVSYHLMSPMTKGLFKRAIAQSGVSTCHWSEVIEPRDRALALAKQLGCTTESDRELVIFFKSLPVEKLVKINAPFTLAEKENVFPKSNFGVVSEKRFGNNERFFYGDLIDTIHRGIHSDVEILIGYNRDEGLMALVNVGNFANMYVHLNNFPEYYVPTNMENYLSLKEKLDVAKKVKKFYFKDDVVSKENLKDIVKLTNIDLFVYPAILWSKICSKKNKLYFYKFVFQSERNIMSHIMGVGNIIQGAVCHADDLPYLFPVKIIKQKFDTGSRVHKMIQNLTTLWTNFAKYGNPTPDKSLGPIWPQYSADKQEYLEIGDDLVPSSFPDKEDIEFWEGIFREHFPKMLA